MDISTQKIPKRYKQTDVGVIPQDWQVLKLNDVAKYRRGSFPQPYGLDKWYDDTFGKPFIQVFDVSNEMRLKNDTKRKISKEAQELSVFVKKGSVVLTIQGSIGRVAVTQYDAYMDRTLLLFKSFIVPIDKYYFIYALFVLFEKEKIKAPGGTIKTITKEKLSDFLITVPSISEQIAIAKVLVDTDKLIETLEKLIAKKKAIKLGAMQDLLTGKKRLPGFSGEWEEKRLGDIFEITRGQVLATSKISKEKIADYQYPVYSSQTQNNGLLGYYNDYLFENCITWTTDGANAGDVNYRKGKFYCTNVCGVLKSISGYANNCVATAFNMVSKKYVSYVGNPKLMNNVVAGIHVHLPSSIKEQLAISRVLKDIKLEIDCLEQKRSKCLNIKIGMMQQLLTGKIRLI